MFVLYFNEYPFDDTLTYSDFVEDNDNYWRRFDKKNPDVFITEAFTDLFNGMLHKNPEKRLKIDEIANHEWFNGRVASHEEVVNDLNIRHQFNR